MERALTYFGNVILRHWLIANVITKQLIIREFVPTDQSRIIMRPSKGGSLVALSHPSVYLCRLTSGGNCHCRFSVQIHMSLSLQKFVSDVSLR